MNYAALRASIGGGPAEKSKKSLPHPAWSSSGCIFPQQCAMRSCCAPIVARPLPPESHFEERTMKKLALIAGLTSLLVLGCGPTAAQKAQEEAAKAQMAAAKAQEEAAKATAKAMTEAAAQTQEA